MPVPSRALPLLLGLPLLAPVAVALALRFGPDPRALEAAAPLRHRADGFAGAAACATCHPDHHASWAATFHSTMTRLPSDATVAGAFDGREVHYEGQAARLLRDGDRFVMDLPDGAGRRRAEVALVVGSRRYQQYFEREPDGGLVRLPLLWHVADRRFLPLNSVFLDPDHADWDQHRARWNENCIFCHNTAARPGRAGEREATGFDSRVADLGIACESCHGPGAAHVQRNRDPRERLAATAGRGSAPDIVDPGDLDAERANSLCGQCHGQRMPRPIERLPEWLRSGSTFRAGDALLDHVEPIVAATPSPDPARPQLFADRFYGDGTPRLSAYEYQGIVQSRCGAGELDCLDCHAMHSGDPRGQIRPDRRGDAACAPCHGDIVADAPRHARHAPGSSGTGCVECHMPRMVYGILDVHRSHRIEIPDPARDAAAGRPDACTLCHLDRSLAWAAEAAAARFETPRQPAGPRRDGAPAELPDSVASLLAGDPVVRATYARAMGRADAALAPAAKGFLRVHLAIALGDAYPSIRRLAQQSLDALERELPIGAGSGSFDHLAEFAVRRAAVADLVRAVAARAAERLAGPSVSCFLDRAHRPDLGAMMPLLESQAARAIAIGE